MPTSFRADAHTSVSTHARGAAFTAGAELHRGALVVHIAGELDLAGRHLATDSCLHGGQLLVRVDMTDLTFIDPDGYGGLVAARNLIERCGGSMIFLNATGQPHNFLANIATKRT